MGAPGDVAEVTELRANVAFLDVGVELRVAVADGVEKVCDVADFAAGAIVLLHLFAFHINDAVTAAVVFKRAGIAVKSDERKFFAGAREATAAVPGDASFTEIVCGDGGVGRLLVVIEMVAIPFAGNAGGMRDAEAPAGDVERVDAVVAEFAVAPMPMPMPVVMDEVVFVRT